MAAIDRTELVKKYPGKWIAFADDQETVMGVGDSLEEAAEEARRNGNNDPIFSRMPTDLLPRLISFYRS